MSAIACSNFGFQDGTDERDRAHLERANFNHTLI